MHKVSGSIIPDVGGHLSVSIGLQLAQLERETTVDRDTAASTGPSRTPTPHCATPVERKHLQPHARHGANARAHAHADHIAPQHYSNGSISPPEMQRAPFEAAML